MKESAYRLFFHKRGFLFLADEQVRRIILEFGRGRGDFLQCVFFAAVFAPALNAFLMGDAKEPASELFVVTQAVDVPRCADERFLYDIEGRLFIVNQLEYISVERQLVAPEKNVPS